MEKLGWKNWDGGRVVALKGDASSDGRRARRPAGRLRRRWWVVVRVMANEHGSGIGSRISR